MNPDPLRVVHPLDDAEPCPICGDYIQLARWGTHAEWHYYAERPRPTPVGCWLLAAWFVAALVIAWRLA